MAGKGKGKARKRKWTPPPNPDLFDGDEEDVAPGPSRSGQQPRPSASRLEGEEGGAKATPKKIPARAGGGTKVTPQPTRSSNEARASSSTARPSRGSTHQVDVRPTEAYTLRRGEDIEMVPSRSPSPQLRPRRERPSGLRRDDSPPHRRVQQHDHDSNEPWTYNPITQLVCHSRCTTCMAYSSHYMTAATRSDRSLREATERQHEAVSATINAKLLRAELEIANLRREKEHYRDTCYELQADLDRWEEHGKRKRPRPSNEPSSSRDVDRSTEWRTVAPPPSAQLPVQRSNPIIEQDVTMGDIAEELDSREFPELPTPASPNQPVHTRPWIDNLGVPRLPSGERDNSVGLPGYVHYSPVDNTVRVGARADRAQENSQMAIPPPPRMALYGSSRENSLQNGSNHPRIY